MRGCHHTAWSFLNCDTSRRHSTSEGRTVGCACGLQVVHRHLSSMLAWVQSFHSRQGKAYLFNAVVNVLEGPKEERLMTTGKLSGRSAF